MRVNKKKEALDSVYKMEIQMKQLEQNETV